MLHGHNIVHCSGQGRSVERNPLQKQRQLHPALPDGRIKSWPETLEHNDAVRVNSTPLCPSTMLSVSLKRLTLAAG
jgi:hypothetical protein